MVVLRFTNLRKNRCKFNKLFPKILNFDHLKAAFKHGGESSGFSKPSALSPKSIIKKTGGSEDDVLNRKTVYRV